MPTVSLSPLFNAQVILDNEGNPLNAGRVSTYLAGSTTPATTYIDAAGTLPATNPIILNASGRLTSLMYLDNTLSYKLVLTTSTNVQLGTFDNIAGIITTQNQSVPSGTIVMWSGPIANIPIGWALCDGLDGRPDLRDKFVIGAGNAYQPNTTGGSADAIVVAHMHTTTVVDPGHHHTIEAQPGLGQSGAFGGGVSSARTTITSTTNPTGISVNVNSTGTSGTNANLPPYLALAFIIKL